MGSPLIDPCRRRQLRDQVLRYIYENGAGSPNWDVPVEQIQEALQITGEELGTVSMLLYNQQLLPLRGQVGHIGLNASGQAEAERLGPLIAMRDVLPQHPTVFVGNASNSVIQVAGSHSSQNAALSIQQSQALNLLGEIDRALPSLPLSPESRREAGDLVTALRKGVEKAASSAVNKALATALDALLSPVGSMLGQRLLNLMNGGA